MKVTILGAGVPTPTETRFGSAYVLQIGEDTVLVDCGPATTWKLVKAGFWPTEIDHLFFTHHHFDHNADYPCFLLCRWDQSVGAEKKLKVFGPQPTTTLTRRLIDPEIGAFSDDWKARVNFSTSQRVFVNRGGTLPRPEPSVSAQDIEAGFDYQGPSWRLTSCETEHVQPYLDSVAYRFEHDGVSVVFAGDGQPCAAVEELARGANTMICMCWDGQDEMEAGGENVGQSGTRDAATLAQKAGVQRLVLTHMGSALAAHGRLERGIGEVASLYDGEVVFAEEFAVLDIEGSNT